MRHKTRAWALAALAAIGLLVSQPIHAEEAWPDPDWSVAKPADHGLDKAALDELVRVLADGKAFGAIHSVLVVRDGHLVLERYFRGWSRDRLHTLQSVTKSIASALIGIAVDQGVLSVDEKVLDFFPEATPTHLDGRKHAIRVEDLLTMRSGTDYTEGFSGSPHSTLNSLPRGWDKFYLDRPMEAVPGTRFKYDSGGAILLSSLLNVRTGEHADIFADRHLFGPLGIDRVKWFRNRDAHPHTGGGLDLRPRDLAKFGLLFLRGGRWKDRQVISPRWVETSTESKLDLRRPSRHVSGYGYLWWIGPPGAGDKEPVVSARGFMGQYLFLVPEHDLLLVVTAGVRGRAEFALTDVLYRHVLPAVKR